MKILVTGANGFIGTKLSSLLVARGYSVRCAVRCIKSISDGVMKRLCDSEIVEVGDIGENVNWFDILADVDVVVHLAGRTREVKEVNLNALAEYRKVNVEGTRQLALAASASQVKKFIYVSSIGVNGSQTTLKAFTEKDEPNPHYDNYALSKWEAEQFLQNLAKNGGMELVIVRPALVYGPGVKGNMLRLLHLIDRGLPLPLASVSNLRSLISVDNLSDLLVRCIEHPNAAGQIFLAADGEDISTPDLIRHVAKAMDRQARLLPIPKVLLHIIGGLLGRRDAVDRLCGSLVVDSLKVRKKLNWKPRVSIDDGLIQMAHWYLSEYAKKNNA